MREANIKRDKIVKAHLSLFAAASFLTLIVAMPTASSAQSFLQQQPSSGVQIQGVAPRPDLGTGGADIDSVANGRPPVSILETPIIDTRDWAVGSDNMPTNDPFRLFPYNPNLQPSPDSRAIPPQPPQPTMRPPTPRMGQVPYNPNVQPSPDARAIPPQPLQPTMRPPSSRVERSATQEFNLGTELRESWAPEGQSPYIGRDQSSFDSDDYASGRVGITQETLASDAPTLSNPLDGTSYGGFSPEYSGRFDINGPTGPLVPGRNFDSIEDQIDADIRNNYGFMGDTDRLANPSPNPWQAAPGIDSLGDGSPFPPIRPGDLGGPAVATTLQSPLADTPAPPPRPYDLGGSVPGANLGPGDFDDAFDGAAQATPNFDINGGTGNPGVGDPFARGPGFDEAFPGGELPEYQPGRSRALDVLDGPQASALPPDGTSSTPGAGTPGSIPASTSPSDTPTPPGRPSNLAGGADPNGQAAQSDITRDMQTAESGNIGPPGTPALSAVVPCNPPHPWPDPFCRYAPPVPVHDATIYGLYTNPDEYKQGQGRIGIVPGHELIKEILGEDGGERMSQLSPETPMGPPSGSLSGASLDVLSQFQAGLQQGGLSNPFGLAAVLGNAMKESGFSIENALGSWSDPSASGQPGTSGGIWSWRNERLDGMRSATLGASNIPFAQAQYLLQESSGFLQALNGASSLAEANNIVRNNLRYAGGAAEEMRRLGMAERFLSNAQSGVANSLPSGLPRTAATNQSSILTLNTQILEALRSNGSTGGEEEETPEGVTGQGAGDCPAMAQPLNGGRLTSGFGMRNHPVHRVRRMHTGIDLACTTGTPIYATASGIVTSAGPAGGYGNTVNVGHGGTCSTRYAHLSRIAVPSGTRVSQGQLIGYCGSTGVSTGPHLHYEVRTGGRPVDPKTAFGTSNSSTSQTLTRGIQTPQSLQAGSPSIIPELLGEGTQLPSINLESLTAGLVDELGQALNVDLGELTSGVNLVSSAIEQFNRSGYSLNPTVTQAERTQIDNIRNEDLQRVALYAQAGSGMYANETESFVNRNRLLESIAGSTQNWPEDLAVRSMLQGEVIKEMSRLASLWTQYLELQVMIAREKDPDVTIASADATLGTARSRDCSIASIATAIEMNEVPRQLQACASALAKDGELSPQDNNVLADLQDFVDDEALNENFDQVIELNNQLVDVYNDIRYVEDARDQLEQSYAQIQEHERVKYDLFEIEKGILAGLREIAPEIMAMSGRTPEAEWFEIKRRLLAADTTTFFDGSTKWNSALNAARQIAPVYDAFNLRQLETRLIESDSPPPPRPASWERVDGPIRNALRVSDRNTSLMTRFQIDMDLEICQSTASDNGEADCVYRWNDPFLVSFQFYLEAHKRKDRMDKIRRGVVPDGEIHPRNIVLAELTRDSGSRSCLTAVYDLNVDKATGKGVVDAALVAPFSEYLDVHPECGPRNWLNMTPELEEAITLEGGNGIIPGEPISHMFLRGLDAAIWAARQTIADHEERYADRSARLVADDLTREIDAFVNAIQNTR